MPGGVAVVSCFQNSRRIDERDVGEGLRKIAQLPFRDWIVFLGEKALAADFTKPKTR